MSARLIAKERRSLSIRHAVITAAILLAAWPPSTTPPPATPEEVEEFCNRYLEVRDEGWNSMMNSLIDVSPAEIRGPVVRIANGPGEDYWQDRRVIEDFVERCES